MSKLATSQKLHASFNTKYVHSYSFETLIVKKKINPLCYTMREELNATYIKLFSAYTLYLHYQVQ